MMAETLTGVFGKALIGLNLNLLFTNIKKTKLFNQPITQQLWKKFYEAFYNSFILISDNKLKYTKEQREISSSVKTELKRYIGDSNYFALIQIFQEFSGENFENFLYNLREDKEGIFKAKISDALYEKLQLKIRIEAYEKDVVTEVLINALVEYNDSFLSTLDEKAGQRILIEEIFNTREKLDSFRNDYLNALNILIENAPDKLDHDLLSKLSSKNLNQFFQKEFSCLGQTIRRKEEFSLFSSIEKSLKPLIFLSGNSGVGKSYTCLQLLHNLEDKNIVFWIDAKNIQNSNSLEQSIHLQLKEIKSNLSFDYSDFHKTYEGKRLFVVIDDINRTNNPSKIAGKLLSWRFQSEKIQRPTFSIICPVWENNYQSFINQNPKAKSRSQRLQLSIFDEADAELLIEKIIYANNISLSKIEVSQIAKSLNYDPFLIGLIEDLIQEGTSDILSLSKSPIKKFIAKHLDRIAEKLELPLYQVKKELKNLALFMLHEKKYIHFNWDDFLIYSSGKGKNTGILSSIGKDGNIFKISDDNGDVQFRHDRIRDALLVSQLSSWIESGEIDNTIFKEIFFDDLLSQSILDVELSDEIIVYFIEENPTVLFESIKYLDNSKSENRNKIVLHLKKWLNKEKKYSFLESEINSIFTRTISPIIIDVTEGIKLNQNREILATRFANGDMLSALQYFDLLNDNDTDFLPSTQKYNHLPFGEYLETVKIHYSQVCSQQISEILLEDNLSVNRQKFLIQLVGLLGFDMLGDSVFALWKKSQHKKSLMSSIIWTLLICYKVKYAKYLKEIIHYWDEGIEIDKNWSNDVILKHLRFINVWENISDNGIEEMLSWSILSVNIRKLTFEILKSIDNPKIVNALFTQKDYREEVFRDIENYKDPKWLKSRHIWLSKSIEYKVKNAELSRNSLILYISSSQKNDLVYLRKIHFDYYKLDDVIFNIIAWRRLKLGDSYLKSDLVDYFSDLIDNDIRWIYFSPYLWDEKIWITIKSKFEKDSISVIAAMSVFLSKENAEVVLIECWKYISQKNNLENLNKICSRYVDNHHSQGEEHIQLLSKYKILTEASLLSRSQKVLYHLNQLITKISRPNPLFGGLYHQLHSKREFLGFSSWSIINRVLLNREELDVLTPYVKYFEQHPASHRSQQILDLLAQLALSGENYDWTIHNVKPYLKTMNKTDIDIKGFHQIYLDVIKEGKHSINANLQYIYFPTDEVIINELNEYIKEGWFEFPSIYWIQSFKKRSINQRRFFLILRQFLIQNSDINALKFVAKCIALAGNRSHLSILDVFKSQEGVEEIILKTHFSVNRRSLQ